MEEISTPKLFRTRTFGEVLSDSISFIQKYAKVIFKSIALIIIPICMIQGYFANSYFGTVLSTSITGGNYEDPTAMAYSLGFNLLAIYVLSIVTSSVIYGLCATIMTWHHEGKLTKQTTLKEMKSDIIHYAIKTFQSFLSIGICIIIGVMILAIAGGILGAIGGAVLGIIVVFLLVFAILIFMLPLFLAPYPVYFKNYGIINALIEGYRYGFQHWGRTFGVSFLMGLLMSIGQGIFIVPLYIVLFIKLMLTTTSTADSFFIGDIAGYISGILFAFGTYIFLPLIVIPMGFHYTSIVEEKEGVSLQEQIKNFEEL